MNEPQNFEYLVLRFLDGDLDGAELDELQRNLRDNSQNQQTFVQLCNQSARLKELRTAQEHSCLAPVFTASKCDTTNPNRIKPGILAFAASLLLAASLAMWLLSGGTGNQDNRSGVADTMVAKVASLQGNLSVNNLGASIGDSIPAMALLGTHQGNYAVVEFADGTQIKLTGETKVRLCDTEVKQVIVESGTIAASVRKQPVGRPLLVTTEGSNIEVLGTSLAVSTLHHTTALAVTSGKVRMTRKSDGETVEVGSGQFAKLTSRGSLQANVLPEIPTTWRETFEDGLPVDWQDGQLVRSDLPANSTQGVTTVLDDVDNFHLIVSQNAWMDGLVRITESSQLNIRMKMQRPGFYHLMVGCRDANFANTESIGNYEYQEDDPYHVDVGVWRTLTVPLSKFKQATGDYSERFSDRIRRAPAIDDVLFFVLLSSQTEDLGIVIDEIWITQQ